MALKSGQNPNHPKRGSSIKVDPIRDLNLIKQIKYNLLKAQQYRNHCLFTLGINTAWRANELLSLNVSQVIGLAAGDTLHLKQSKTDEYRTVLLNAVAVESIQLWLEHYDFKICVKAPLFPSRQFGRLGVPALCNLVKRWCWSAGAAGNYGSHTLRKTWGYHQRMNGASVALISRALGHTSEAQTLAYLGILAEEIRALYLGVEL